MIANDAVKLILEVTDQNLAPLMEAERAVLVLTKSDCGHCAAYQAEIEALLERADMGGTVIGKMPLNQRGVIRDFKRNNPWLADLKVLPYTLLYSKGQRVDGFAASKGSYLLERIEDAFA
jgi:hypothetical protein